MVQTIDTPVAEREALFIHLYQQAFPLLAKYVAQKGGTFEEAKDIFQDALVIWYEKTRNGPVTLQYSEKSYLLGIARHLWSKKFNDKTQAGVFDDQLTGSTTGDTAVHTSSEKLLHLLQTTGRKCMELLRAFYYDQVPLAKLANRFGFSGVRSATVQKYKCLEKVRDTIKEKSLTYEDFLE